MSFMARRGFCVALHHEKHDFAWRLTELPFQWENKPMTVEEAGMETQATEIDQMILQLNEFILPSSLMESFDAYREEAVKDAARTFQPCAAVVVSGHAESLSWSG